MKCADSDHPAYLQSHQELFSVIPITKTPLFKYIENFTTKKGKFSDKKF